MNSPVFPSLDDIYCILVFSSGSSISFTSKFYLSSSRTSSRKCRKDMNPKVLISMLLASGLAVALIVVSVLFKYPVIRWIDACRHKKRKHVDFWALLCYISLPIFLLSNLFVTLIIFLYSFLSMKWDAWKVATESETECHSPNCFKIAAMIGSRMNLLQWLLQLRMWR